MRFAELRRALWHLRNGGVDGLRRHLRRQRRVPGSPRVDTRARAVAQGALGFEPWQPLTHLSRRQDLRVAVILDPFSALAFSFEWDQVAITPDGWRAELEANPPQLLFVESAWNGNDGAWRFLLTGSKGPSPQLRELVGWCQGRRIPTVFWNKEDPTHTEDFLECAALFDHVFTTDADLLDFYRDALGHTRVAALGFAAQPAIHNPIRPAGGHQNRDVAFAGMYFAHRHPERREQMDLLLNAARNVSPRMEHGLEIFSRQLGGDERYQFPAPLDKAVVGTLEYHEMLSAYRAYKVFLNVNTVTTSSTMCARRVFEISASGTPVVSTASPAISATFPSDEVVQVDTRRGAEFAIRSLVTSPELRDRIVHRAQRRIWREHTYSHRVDDVLEVAQLGDHVLTRNPRTVTAVVSSNRPQQLTHVLRTIGSQRDVPVQLAFLAHGWDVDERSVRELASEAGVHDLVILRADQDVPLGACLNRLVDAADGDLVAKVDDDDFYGPYYLRDQIDALEFSGAELVGKQAHFVHLLGADLLALRFPEREHRFTDFVMGPTLLTSRSTAQALRFPEVGLGEDSAFLRSVISEGGRVYSASRFEFAQVRGGASHTWGASDYEILASARVQVAGHATNHVLVKSS